VTHIVSVAIAMVIMFSIPASAYADASLDDAAAALKNAPVYIAPGTEGTSPTTASDLTDLLRDGDNIAVVMLPANAGEPSQAAGSIDQTTSHKKIVAVSVGGNLAASSGIMPNGVADDLLTRAVNVSTNPVETLQAFIRIVHNWQSQHPQATASKPAAKDDGFPWVLIIFGAAIATTGIALFIRSKQTKSYATSEGSLRFRAAPDNVREILRDIMDKKSEVKDSALRSTIEQACQDTEQYFARNSDPSKRGEDTSTFVNHLKSVRNVLVQYLDIQSNKRYYDDADELMQQGYNAITGFAEFVLQSNKRGRRSELTNFKVDTQILDAQRFS
jgi:hypothetical protein